MLPFRKQTPKSKSNTKVDASLSQKTTDDRLDHKNHNHNNQRGQQAFNYVNANLQTMNNYKQHPPPNYETNSRNSHQTLANSSVAPRARLEHQANGQTLASSIGTHLSMGENFTASKVSQTQRNSQSQANHRQVLYQQNGIGRSQRRHHLAMRAAPPPAVPMIPIMIDDEDDQDDNDQVTASSRGDDLTNNINGQSLARRDRRHSANAINKSSHRHLIDGNEHQNQVNNNSNNNNNNFDRHYYYQQQQLQHSLAQKSLQPREGDVNLSLGYQNNRNGVQRADSNELMVTEVDFLRAANAYNYQESVDFNKSKYDNGLQQNYLVNEYLSSLNETPVDANGKYLALGQLYQSPQCLQVKPRQLQHSYSYHHLAQYNNNNSIPLNALQAQYLTSQKSSSDTNTERTKSIQSNQNQSKRRTNQLSNGTSSLSDSSQGLVSSSYVGAVGELSGLQTDSPIRASTNDNMQANSRQYLTSPAASIQNTPSGSRRNQQSSSSSNRSTHSKKISSQMAANGHNSKNQISRNGRPTLGCCGKLAKSLLFLVNLIFWSSGIALGAWGILALVEDHKYNLSQLLVFEPNSRMSLFQLLSWSFITLGCAAILVGFCGCSALFKNNRWILGLYIFLILAIFALDLATGLLAIIFQERLVANVRLRLANKLRNEYGVQASFTAAIDYIQTKFECCGLEGHFDYDQSLWRLQRLGGYEATVARTCCHLRNTFDDQAHVNPRPVNESMCQSTDVRFHQSYRYRKGCLDDFERLIRQKIWTFIIVCAAVGAVILVSLVFATCFCRSIPSPSSRKGSISDQNNANQSADSMVSHKKVLSSKDNKQRHHR